ncbi:hypothetical protein Q3G72_034341 [Acer saccharum]|nr:hypothetical protein Q3G72_034341 [Acer saccharum]
MAPRKFLDFFFLCFSFFFLFKFSVVVFADNNNNNNVSFNFPSFTLRNVTLLGDSYLRNGVIGLTRELGVPSSSSGTVVYNNPVPFFDQDTNTTASFSTRIDSHFDDPDENHVGLDIDSLNSIKTADPILQGIDLKSGNLITTWIDYKNDLRVLKVFMSYTTSKPEKPVLTVDVDLSEYLKEVMYVGFSASTEGSTELHLIEDWSFRSFGFLPVRSRLHPHNVSDSSVTTVPDLPIANSTNKHHHKVSLGFGIAGPAFFCVVLAVFGYISVKKWKGMRIGKGQKTELVAGPREFSYKDLHQATKGLSCANPDSSERPSMRRVLQLLNGEAEPAFVPKVKPSLTFSTMSLNIEDIVSDDSDED